MIAEIKYNGYTATPGDYECPDGDLALSMGLINEDGAMKPLSSPTPLFTLRSGQTVKYIHKTTAFIHYIIKDGNQLWWRDKDDSSDKLISSFPATTIHQITSVGNTLIILAADGIHYILWKETGYEYIGSEIPECPLSFGLQGEVIKSDQFTITFNSVNAIDIANGKEFSDDNKRIISDQVLAKVNKFIADKSTNKGKFIYPFLLRYAYRLYDGTLTKHSAPILMVASSDLAPQVFFNRTTGESGSINSANLEIVGALHTIDYAADATAMANLKKWKDIVSSIDIFISKPIYTYDQNGECTQFAAVDMEKDSYCICKHINQTANTSTYPVQYQYNNFSKLYAFTFNPTDFKYPNTRLLLPRRSTEEVKNDINNCSQFYFLESIKLDALTTVRTPITVEDNYLQSLVTREVMTDDYDSHDKLIPQYAFPYNSRLNIANLKKVLFTGHSAASLYTYSDGYVSHPYNEGFNTKTSVQVFVFIKQDGKEIIVKGDSGQFNYKMPLLFFYYPNTNAYKAVITRNGLYYEIPLEKHDFLNGAFYFGGWDDVSKEIKTYPTASSESARTVSLPNKIYTSEVNNPFYFPLLGINTVGAGKILGISTAAKALSEGQFGLFPLYAFTDEGIWALEVSGTGTYTAKQPITRDVVINPASITQIDTAVLFASDRGIMHLSGSTCQCISDRLDTETPFSLSSLPKATELLDMYNQSAGETLTIKNITPTPFSQFFTNCGMLYDYPGQRIIVYNPTTHYAYVYSLESRTWGIMRSDIASSVNSYPEALAMTNNDSLVDYSQPSENNDGTTTSLLVTRPFVIDNPNTFKTIDSIIQRGMFRPKHVKQVLYGSNDLYNWLPVWSSVDKIMRGFRGTPYKAYRLALVCTFDKTESIYGFTVSYQTRMTNKIR